MTEKYDPREQAMLKSIGSIYKEMRTEKNLSGREAAEMVSLNQANLSRLENGVNDVSILKLMRIAESYGYLIEFSVVPINYEEEVA